MQFRRSLAALICLVSLAVVGPAHSASLGTAANGYNVFVFGDFTVPGGDTEGNLATGGKITFNGSYSVGKSFSDGANAKIVVDGNLIGNNGELGESGKGTIYASSSSTVTLNGFKATGGIQRPQNQVDFSAAQTEYQSLSTQLSGITANGTVSGSTLNGSDPLLNVFSIDGDNRTFGGLDIHATIGSTVLINVSGSGQIFTNNQINLNGIDPSKVIFNFYESTELSISSYGMYGSFLAAWADVVGNNAQFNGQMIAESFEGSMEFHNVMFDGDTPVNPVPLPAAIWLFAPAFGFLSVLSRRRRPKQGMILK